MRHVYSQLLYQKVGVDVLSDPDVWVSVGWTMELPADHDAMDEVWCDIANRLTCHRRLGVLASYLSAVLYND